MSHKLVIDSSLHYHFLSIKWVWVLAQINHLLGVVNSSFNFLIYWSFCGGRGPAHSKGLSRKTTITRLDTIRGTKSTYYICSTKTTCQGNLKSSETKILILYLKMSLWIYPQSSGSGVDPSLEYFFF